MIERVEKMHRRMMKAEKQLQKIKIALDYELINWCIEEIDCDDERLAIMVEDILDFPDTLREYALDMRS
jgi:succinate dehydrogenase flavin-adding protein (antitoxin of CptAB toxin-antitoxin module)